MNTFKRSMVGFVSTILFLLPMNYAAADTEVDESRNDGQASEEAGRPFYIDTVVNKTKYTNYTNYSQTLGSCKAASQNVTCTISKSTSSTRTVQVGMSLKRGDVTGSLGISSGTTVGVSVSCTSPKMNVGQVFKAWPLGSKYKYRIRRESLLPTEYTGWLYTFNPYTNGFTCGF